MNSGHKKIEVSIIVPVNGTQNDFNNLVSWIETVSSYGIEVLLILDLFSVSGKTNAVVSLEAKMRECGVRVLEGSWGNPGGPRNLGLQYAKKDWIQFVDSDDLPLIEKIADFIINNDLDDKKAIIFDFEIQDIQTNLSIRKRLSRDDFSKALITLGIAPGIWRMVFRREFLGLAKFPELRWGEDQAFLSNFDFKEKDILIAGTLGYIYMNGSPQQITKVNNYSHDLSVALNIIKSHSQNLLNSTMVLKISYTLFRSGSAFQKISALGRIIVNLCLHPVMSAKIGRLWFEFSKEGKQ